MAQHRKGKTQSRLIMKTQTTLTSAGHIKWTNETTTLAAKLNIPLATLAKHICISADMMMGYRSGRYAISKKAWAKLEAFQAKTILDRAADQPFTAAEEDEFQDHELTVFHAAFRRGFNEADLATYLRLPTQLIRDWQRSTKTLPLTDWQQRQILNACRACNPDLAAHHAEKATISAPNHMQAKIPTATRPTPADLDDLRLQMGSFEQSETKLLAPLYQSPRDPKSLSAATTMHQIVAAQASLSDPSKETSATPMTGGDEVAKPEGQTPQATRLEVSSPGKPDLLLLNGPGAKSATSLETPPQDIHPDQVGHPEHAQAQSSDFSKTGSSLEPAEASQDPQA